MDREYEVEHFGFTVQQSTLERKYFLQKIIRNALDAMVNKFNVNEKTCEFLHRAKEEVFDNMWMSMKDEIESLNNLDIKYFTIPDHVLLPPYLDHVQLYTEENEQELDKHLDKLKMTFLENVVMLTTLKLENAQYKNVSTFINNEVKIQQQLKEAFNSVSIDKMNELVNKNNNLAINTSN